MPQLTQSNSSPDFSDQSAQRPRLLQEQWPNGHRVEATNNLVEEQLALLVRKHDVLGLLHTVEELKLVPYL
jgi:hypothetical protein